jgi:hypothetical protein
MYYSYVEIEYIAMSFSPARTDLAVKLLTAGRQSRWILKQLCNTDLKVNADKFDILRTLPEYLEVLTSNRPQSSKA